MSIPLARPVSVPARRPRPRFARLRAWLCSSGAFLVLTPLVVVAGWWLVHAIPHPVPPPRWTHADLPAAPAPAINGWAAVTAEPLDLGIPPELGLAIDHGRAPARVQLAAFVATPAALEALARVEAAAAQPTFADDCRPDADARCHLLAWHQAHDTTLLHALAAELDGDHARASELLATLVRLDMAQLASARSLLSVLIAVDQLDDAFVQAQWLLARLPDDAEARPLMAAIRSVDVRALDLRPLVIGDYLLSLEAIDAALDVGHRRFPSDPGLTRALLDERYARRDEAARAGSIAAALGSGEPALTRTPGWWLHNPGGKLVLDALHFDATSIAVDLERDLGSIAARRTAMLGAGPR